MDKKFILVWPFDENQLDYDSSSKDVFDSETEIIACTDYDWEDKEAYAKEAQVGDYIFVQGSGDLEGLIFRHR